MLAGAFAPPSSARLKDLKASEEDARRWAAYKKIEAERDAIVAELAEYPALAKRISAIVERLAANDVAVDNLNNHTLPSRAPKLRSAELIARDLATFSPAQFVAVPRIGQEMRLVRFEHDKADPYLWPRPAPPVDPSTYSFPKLRPPPPEIERPQSRHQPKMAAGGQS